MSIDDIVTKCSNCGAPLDKTTRKGNFELCGYCGSAVREINIFAEAGQTEAVGSKRPRVNGWILASLLVGIALVVATGCWGSVYPLVFLSWVSAVITLIASFFLGTFISFEVWKRWWHAPAMIIVPAILTPLIWTWQLDPFITGLCASFSLIAWWFWAAVSDEAQKRETEKAEQEATI